MNVVEDEEIQIDPLQRVEVGRTIRSDNEIENRPALGSLYV